MTSRTVHGSGTYCRLRHNSLIAAGENPDANRVNELLNDWQTHFKHAIILANKALNQLQNPQTATPYNLPTSSHVTYNPPTQLDGTQQELFFLKNDERCKEAPIKDPGKTD